MRVAIVIGCAPAIFFNQDRKKLANRFDEMGLRARCLASPSNACAASPTISKCRPIPKSSSRRDRRDPARAGRAVGESHGHVALEDYNMSMQVTAITMKKKPVFVSIVSQVTPSESSVTKKVAYEPSSAHLRDHLSIKASSAS